MTFEEFRSNLSDFDFFKDVKNMTPTLLWDSYMKSMIAIPELIKGKTLSKEKKLELINLYKLTDVILHSIYILFIEKVKSNVSEIMDEYIKDSKRP